MIDRDSPASGNTTLARVLLSGGFVVLWNSGFIAAELGTPYSGPFTLLFWRYLALTVVMAGLVLARGHYQRVAMRQVARTAIVGVLSHGVWLSCVLVAIDRGVPAGVVALVVALQPLLTGALSGLVTGEHTSARQWVGLVVGFGGVALAVGGRLTGGTPAAPGYYLLPFVSAAAITVASLIQRRSELTGPEVSPPLDLQLLIQSGVTTLALFVPAVALESLATRWTVAYSAVLIWLVLAVSLGAYALMWTLLTCASATKMASLFFLGPPATMFMAWAVIGDSVVVTDIAGLAVAGLGVLLVTVPARGGGSPDGTPAAGDARHYPKGSDRTRK